MKLVEENNPILRKTCEPFDFNEPVMDPYELTEGLHKLRKGGAGIGLAAPQVGINTQVLVIGMGNFETEGVDDYDQVFFNPTVVETNTEQMYMVEGCLSFPNLFVKVKRPTEIILKWDTEEGSECEEKFVGMTSRILQHEIDHLNGITFLQRANRFHLQKAQKNRKLSDRRRNKIEEA
jgi:peptide deformylase